MKKILPLLLACLFINQAHAAESQKATFAAGCFWCVEAIYEQVPGVLDAVSGFSGGEMQHPTYRSHGDHTETVDVSFDPDQVSYEQLLRIFWNSHDITDARGVAPDFGRSYRPALFYRSPEQLATIERVKAELPKAIRDTIATEILPFEKFWPAEDYHQDFVKRNPKHPYVRNVSLPRVRETLGQ
ncbi:MAG: peptide-methionine (S)-S-oxide reductase [Lentimonas sp.]|jgi:peptide-methionine (S)-S-oxide reductase